MALPVVFILFLSHLTNYRQETEVGIREEDLEVTGTKGKHIRTYGF